MDIPTYVIKNTVRHLKRIVTKCRTDPFDSTTANALRLARKDLLTLQKLLDKHNQSS